MTMQHLTLALILASVLAIGAGSASPVIELSELQAVSSGGPPYIFRLPLTLRHHDRSPVPAVIVRRPANVLSLVTPEMIELHLSALTEVEVEISHDGQTLNRLFPIAELQAAGTRLQARLARERDQTAANSQESPRPTVPLHEARHVPQSVGQVDPLGARQPLSHIERARRDRLSPASSPVEAKALNTAWGEAVPAALTTSVGVERKQLEDEMRLIREDIRHLIAPVVPWTPGSPPLSQGAMPLTPGLGVVLGGLFAAGAAVLLTTRLLRRHAQERRHRQLFAARLAKAKMALPRSGLPWVLPTAPPTSPSVRAAGSWQPLVVRQRHLRVWFKATRRVRLCTAPGAEGTAQQRHNVAPTHHGGPVTRHGGVLVAALRDAFGNLCGDRHNPQRPLPLSARSGEIDADSRQSAFDTR